MPTTDDGRFVIRSSHTTHVLRYDKGTLFCTVTYKGVVLRRVSWKTKDLEILRFVEWLTKSLAASKSAASATNQSWPRKDLELSGKGQSGAPNTLTAPIPTSPQR